MILCPEKETSEQSRNIHVVSRTILTISGLLTVSYLCYFFLHAVLAVFLTFLSTLTLVIFLSKQYLLTAKQA